MMKKPEKTPIPLHKGIEKKEPKLKGKIKVGKSAERSPVTPQATLAKRKNTDDQASAEQTQPKRIKLERNIIGDLIKDFNNKYKIDYLNHFIFFSI